MSRFLLDTNVLSNLVRPAPSPSLLAWMTEQKDDDLYISVLTLAEIERGIAQLPDGRRRQRLEDWFAGAEGPSRLFAGRIVDFDQRAASFWANLMAAGKRIGRPRSALDMIIAACALAIDAVVVTDNERDFEGIDTVNPLRSP